MPDATPTLVVDFRANRADVNREHKLGKRVGWFHFVLEAELPGNPSCQRRQD